MSYVDTYLSSSSLTALESFLAAYETTVPIQKGHEAQEAETDEATGETGAAREALGDADLYYSCVRTSADISGAIEDPLSVVDEETGSALVGVFAS